MFTLSAREHRRRPAGVLAKDRIHSRHVTFGVRRTTGITRALSTPRIRGTLMAVCSQNRIRSKSGWGHGDLPQKPRFSWSERYLGTRVEPAGGRDHRHGTILIAF